MPCNTDLLVPRRVLGAHDARMPVIDHTSPVAQEPSAFEVAVRARSWDWLLELRRRLKIDLQLVDSRFTPLLPIAASGSIPSLSGLFEQRDPSLLSAISTAMRTRATQAVGLPDIQITCIALTVERSSTGALVVGRLLPHRQDVDASRAQLELVGSWLSTAIEAHLLSPPSLHASGVNRVAPLARLLADAAEREPDRELIRLFGEAVAVWHDIDVSGYVEAADKSFSRDVTLPGTRTGERPSTIPALGLPDAAELTRLPQAHLDRFGLPVNSDVYVCQFRRGDGRAWLLVFTGVIGTYDLQRLGAYVALLDVALAFGSAEATSRLIAVITARLADVDQSPEVRVGRVLDELRTMIGATAATVTIESANGAVLLRSSSPAPLGEVNGATKGARLAVVNRSDRHYTTTVTVGRAESLQFTPRDHAAADAAAGVLNAWAPAVLRVPIRGRDRRSISPGFSDVIERSAREAVERGSPVTAVVLLVRDAVYLPGSTQRWVAGMRGQMRPSDLAGMLAEGEIGLLMHDTTAQHAKNIAERLRAVVGGSPGAGVILIGVATRMPGAAALDGIVRDARADALRTPDTTSITPVAHEVRR